MSHTRKYTHSITIYGVNKTETAKVRDTLWKSFHGAFARGQVAEIAKSRLFHKKGRRFRATMEFDKAVTYAGALRMARRMPNVLRVHGFDVRLKTDESRSSIEAQRYAAELRPVARRK